MRPDTQRRVDSYNDQYRSYIDMLMIYIAYKGNIAIHNMYGCLVLWETIC